MNRCTGPRHGMGFKVLGILGLISLISLVAEAQSDGSRVVSEASGMRTFSLTGLHIFNNIPDGASPVSLVEDNAGNFYGATQNGGTGQCFTAGGTQAGCGTVFELTPNASGGFTYNVIYELQGGIDGQSPTSLSIDGQGNLYGTTIAANGLNNGAVFELSRESDGSWVLANAYDFAGTTDGAVPEAPVIVDSAGNVYGTTLYSFTGNGPGTVFELQLVRNQWIETTLSNNLGNLSSGLIMDSKGDLYGTAPGTGDVGAGAGSVFKLHNIGENGWVQTTVYSFQGGANDGSNPSGNLIFDKAGNIYGTAAHGLSSTGSGNGGVYKLTRSGKITWLYAFTGGTDGANPKTGVVFDATGNLYGVTSQGEGPSCVNGTFCGRAFELMPSTVNGTTTWTEDTLYTFTSGLDGDLPQGPLQFDKAGDLFGTAFYGGVGYGISGFGTAFELTPNPVPTATTITANTPNPSKVGQVVTVSFNVVPTVKGNSKPTGLVTVNASTGEACVAALPANGKANCQLLFISAGTRTLTATYSGDADNLSSISSALTQKVMSPTTTAITMNTPNPGKVGHAVIVLFTVKASDATKQTMATGNVTVNASSGESCTGTLHTQIGRGRCELTFTSAGLKTLVATYPGDADNEGSVSLAVAQNVK